MFCTRPYNFHLIQLLHVSLNISLRPLQNSPKSIQMEKKNVLKKLDFKHSIKFSLFSFIEISLKFVYFPFEYKIIVTHSRKKKGEPWKNIILVDDIPSQEQISSSSPPTSTWVLNFRNKNFFAFPVPWTVRKSQL